MSTTVRGRKGPKAEVQEAILEFLRDYKRTPDNDGNSPTYQEIADALGKDPSNVYRCVCAMQRQGQIAINRRGKIILIGGQYLPPE